MRNHNLWHQAWLTLIALVLAASLLSCATNEEKRDKCMTQGKAAFEKGEFTTARLHFKNAVQLDPKLAEGYLWLGKTDLRSNDPRRAFGALSKAVELKPDLLEAQVTLGSLLLLAQRPNEAEAKANLVLAKEPGNTDALMLKAGVALARQQPDQALDLLEQVKKLDPHKVQAYLMQYGIEVKEKKLEAAAGTLEAGIKANPQATVLYLSRAQLAGQQNQYDQAEAFLKKAQASAPQEPVLLEALAHLYIRTQHWDKAEETLRQWAILEPDKEGPMGALAQFLARRGRFDDGEKFFKDFLTQHPKNLQAKFALAHFYLAQRKFGKGEQLLQSIATDDPSSPGGLKAKNELAALRLSQSQKDEADKLVQEVLKTNPKDLTALKLQGLIALTDKDGLKAVRNFRILTQDQPQDPENWLLLARAQLVNNIPVLAKEAAKKALSLKPDYPEARDLLYGIYFNDQDYDGLIKLIKEYLRTDEQDWANWGYLGDAYVFKGDEDAARNAFQKMITLNPQHPAGYIKMALLSRKIQQPDKAVQYLETALKQNPNAHPALRFLISIHLEGNQPDKALKSARAAVSKAPKNAEMHQILGEVLLAQNQPEAAAAALIEALTLNPADPQALALLVRAYDSAADKAAALKTLEDKAANPQAPWFYSLALAQLYERQGAGDQAIPFYEKLLDRQVEPAVVKNNLAYLLAEHRPTPANLDRAQKMAAEILADHPGDPRLLDTMGWIYCRQNEFAKGKTYLEKAVAKVPKHPMFQYHLGFCLAKLGETTPARKALEQALNTPGDFPARDAAQKLLDSLPMSAP